MSITDNRWHRWGTQNRCTPTASDNKRELAKTITVNTIPPGLVDTPMARSAEEQGKLPSIKDLGAMMPLKRVATGEDIAAACHFLCSDEAGYITGAQINVNGGVYM